MLNREQERILYNLSLFKEMSDEFKRTLLERLDYSLIPLTKGEVVIKQNTPCQHLLILLSGNLEVNIIDVSGNNIKVENIIAPRSFATPHLFGDNDIFPATFTAIEDSLLLKATKESVFKLISSNPELLKSFLRARGNCNECTIGRLRILSYKKIRSRFIFYLINRKQSDDYSVMGHNQTQLADYINVSRPALAKEIKEMCDEGLIQLEGKKVLFANYPELLKYI